MSIITLLILFFGGCIGGLLAGLLGIGGGLVFVLIFTNYLTAVQVSDADIAQMIIANSMFAIFFAGLSGSIRHFMNGNFYIRPIMITGIMAAICSVAMTYFINHTTWYNKYLFTIIFVLIAGYTAFKILLAKENQKEIRLGEESSAKKYFLIGGLGGILAALSGVGGGIIMVPMLTSMLHIPIKKATAISLGVITLTAFLSSTYTFLIHPNVPVRLPHSYGLIVLPMVLPVAIGCLIFSPLGVGLAKRLSQRTIQVTFALFLLLVVSNMIYKLLWR